MVRPLHTCAMCVCEGGLTVGGQASSLSRADLAAALFVNPGPGGASLVVLSMTCAVFLPFIVIAPIAQYRAMRLGRRWPGWMTGWISGVARGVDESAPIVADEPLSEPDRMLLRTPIGRHFTEYATPVQ